MKNTKAKALADGAVGTALTVLLMIIAMYVPVFALFSIFITGTPIIYLGVRHGTKVSALAALAAVLVLFIITGDPISAILMGIINLLPGAVIAFCMKNGRAYKRTVFAASASVMFGLMLELILLNASGGGHGIENLINGTVDNAKTVLDTVVSRFADVNPDYADTVSSMVDAITERVRYNIFLYMPSFVIGASAILGYGAVAAGLFMLRRMRIAKVLYIPFRRIQASKGMCYFAMICFMIAAFSTDSTVYTAALKNMVTLMYGFIAVSGLAFIDYKLSVKIMSGYKRAAIYALVFVLGYAVIGFLIQALIITGLVDGVFRFRKLIGMGGKDV